MTTLVQKIARRVRRKGLRDAMSMAKFRTYEWFCEQSLGVQTRVDTAPELPQPTGEYNSYEPLSYSCIHRALNSVMIRAGNDVLLDYGCGLGRIVSSASRYPFRRVLGVEINSQLAEQSRLNAARVRNPVAPVEILNVNATQYAVPRDVSVVFMFNPFTGKALHMTAQRVFDSLAEQPRRLTLIYVNPLADPDPFATCGWLHRKQSLSAAMWHDMRFVVYECDINLFAELNRQCQETVE